MDKSKFIAYFKKNHLLIIGVALAAITLFVIIKLGKGSSSGSSGASTGGSVNSDTSPYPSGLSPAAAGVPSGPSTYAPTTTTTTSSTSIYSPTTSSIYSPSTVSNVADSHNVSSSYVGPVSNNSTTTTTSLTNSGNTSSSTYQLPPGFTGISSPGNSGYTPAPQQSYGPPPGAYQAAVAPIKAATQVPLQSPGAGALMHQTYFPSDVSNQFPISPTASPANYKPLDYTNGYGDAFVRPGGLSVAQ